MFKATKINGQTITNNLTKLFDQYGLKNKIISCVKDEGSNLNIMIIALKFVIKCEVLGLDESFDNSCFGHVFFKTCQNATIDKKKFIGISSLFQSNLPNQICKNV